MSKQSIPTMVALACGVIAAAALYDAATIVTRPLWPFFAWMLP